MATGDLSGLTRRRLMASLLAATSTVALLPAARAEDALQVGTPFSFDGLKARMRARAAAPDAPSKPLESFLSDLDYDAYRNIRFDPGRARWADLPSAFQFHAFHPGWLYDAPVTLHEVVDGMAHPLTFSTSDFSYDNDLAADVPDDAALPGIAGFRIHHPLNRPDIFDELITFLGASYFRALGRGNSYGLSARALSVNTWLDGPEEFPRFTEFWLERPAPGDNVLTVHAALDSTSLTGAFRFGIRPGAETEIEVEAALFFRTSVSQLGLCPLTSMFFFSGHSEADFNDYRDRVHDSDVLRIVKADGDVLLRPLNNPPRVANAYFTDGGLQSFGLVQRARRYEDYQDSGALYHHRPSVMIEPLDDWGPGSLRLVEIPAALEIEDNIVLFWVPDRPPEAGETRSFRYRMQWGALPPAPDDNLAVIRETRAGHGGPSGVPIQNPNTRKFVIDLEGGLLGRSPEDAEVTPVVTTSAGTIDTVVLFKVAEAETPAGLWRLVIDIDGADHDLIELGAHVAGYGRKLSETWLFQWVRNPPPADPPDTAETE